MNKPTIVFDLDGTLVDTAPDLRDSLNHCLETAGLQPIGESEIRRFVGFGGKAMIERAFAAEGRALDKDRLDALLAEFVAHYAAHMPGRSHPFPGVDDALTRFADAGWLMAVCTNKYENLSQRLIDALGLAENFAAICGQDTFDFRKPDPRHLTATIEMAGGSPERALMVGDSRTDVDTAKAAGIPVVAVDFGYTDRPVAEFEPSKVISAFDELTLGLAERLLAAAADVSGDA